MSDSNHELNDELISAYVDDELSAGERERVEQVLSEDPRCRQLVEHLLALRANLQSLPDYQLGPDFSSRVLVQATQSAHPQRDSIADFSVMQRSPEAPAARPTICRRTRNWRGVVWAAVAVAAALLLMLSVPRGPQEPNVARLPADLNRGLDAPAGGDRERSAAPLEADLSAPASALGRGRTARPRDEKVDRVASSLDAILKLPNAGSKAAMVPNAPPASLVATAMQESGAQYLVVVNVAKPTEGSRTFERSLARNSIHYDNTTRLGLSVQPSTGRPEGKARFELKQQDQEGYAYQIGADTLSRKAAAVGTQLVVVQAPPEHFQATLDELVRRRDEFPAVDVYYRVVGKGDRTDWSPRYGAPRESPVPRNRPVGSVASARPVVAGHALPAAELPDQKIRHGAPRSAATDRDRSGKRDNLSATPAPRPDKAFPPRAVTGGREEEPAGRVTANQPPPDQPGAEAIGDVSRATNRRHESGDKEAIGPPAIRQKRGILGTGSAGDRTGNDGRERLKLEASVPTPPPPSLAGSRTAVPQGGSVAGKQGEVQSPLRLRQVIPPNRIRVAPRRPAQEGRAGGSQPPVQVLFVLSSQWPVPNITTSDAAAQAPDVKMKELAAPAPVR